MQGSALAAARALAPSGSLRAGINLSNFLLVSSRDAAGGPVGVAPDMAAELARRLEVPLELVPYKNPGLLADAATTNAWDVGLIGAEPQRAETIAFTAPYAEIQATYLVCAGSELRTCADVDQSGVRVGVSRRAAYCLWLESNLRHATLLQTAEPGLDLSREMFDAEGLDALAGLKPWLLTQAESLPGAVVLDPGFTSVMQAIGVPRGRADGGASLFLEHFVGEAVASGFVASLLEKHGVAGRLSVAAS